nr:MAG: P0 protein [Polerovirus monocotyledonae 2]
MLVVNSAGIVGVERFQFPSFRERLGCLSKIQYLYDEAILASSQDEYFISLRFNLSLVYLLPLLLLEGVEYRASWRIVLPQQLYRSLLWYGLYLGWTPAIRIKAGKVRVNLSTLSSIERYRLLLHRDILGSFSQKLKGRPDSILQDPRHFHCLINLVLQQVEDIRPFDNRIPLINVGLAVGQLLDGSHTFDLVLFGQLHYIRAYNIIMSGLHHLNLQGHGLDLFKITNLYYHMAPENALEDSFIQEILKQ